MTVTPALKDLARALRSEAYSALTLLKLRGRPPAARQLEIGSGPVRRPGWVTLDMSRGADVYWDLRRPLPFPDASFERIYCSHVLEHFSFPDLRRLLREVLRVLQPNGSFLIAVPDASLYVEAYRGGVEGDSLMRYRPAVISGRRMDMLNYIFYMGGEHRFMFDADNLAHHCREAGFDRCAVRPFDPSIDSVDREYESLYMQCHKPAAATPTST